jgi:glucose-6-phosphate isomerase
MKTHWELPGFKIKLDSLLASIPSISDVSPENLQSKIKQLSSNGQGFYDWPADPSEITQMEQLAEYLRHDFEGAIIIGIGGSYLGPATIVQALRTRDSDEEFPIVWVSNADTHSISFARRLAREKKVATVLISKSGNTVETLSAFFDLSDDLEPKGIVAISDPKSGTLRELAKKNKWLSLEVPANIGGRFSVLTAVGLFPAWLAGINANGLLEGARHMRSQLNENASENPAFWFAYSLFHWDVVQKHPIQYLMPYHSGLSLFAQWYVQLFAESLGKNGVGPTPIAALGTTDQHSQLQLWKEGPRDKVIGFLDVIFSGAQAPVKRPSFEVTGQDPLFSRNFDEINRLASLATEESLRNSKVPTYRITANNLDEQTLGSLFFFFETACAFAGELYKVNAFDQPGVEEAKRLLKDSLIIDSSQQSGK